MLFHTCISVRMASVLIAALIAATGCSREENIGASYPPDPGFVEYSGSTEPTKITAGNAIAILRDILNSTATYSNSSLLVNKLIDGQASCNRGSYTEEISSDSGLPHPSVDLRFTNCALASISHNYNATYYIESDDPQYYISRLEFVGLRLYEEKDARDVYFLDQITVASIISGSMFQYKSMIGLEKQTRTVLNFNVDEFEKDKLLKFEDINVIYTIEDIYDRDSPLILSITGSPARYYDSERGYVDITTITPLLPYQSLTAYYGDYGELLITGNNSSIRFIPKTTYYFNIQLDLDGDGITDLNRDVVYNAIESTNYVSLDSDTSRWYP